MSANRTFRNQEERVVTTYARLCATTVSSALREDWGDLRHASKRLSRRVGRTPRAVMNWLGGLSSPRMMDLVALMAASPALERAVVELVAEERLRQVDADADRLRRRLHE